MKTAGLFSQDAFRKTCAVILFTAAAASIALFAHSVRHAVDKPFSLDEADIAFRAHLINTQGPFPKGFVTGGGEALTHPPLYDFVLSAVFRLAGETETAGRGFGVLCYLAIVLLSVLTLRETLKSAAGPLRAFAVPLLLLFLLLNPLMVQHAMLIDADTTGTALCVTLFFYVFVRSERLAPPGFFASRVALAVVIALMFLFKEAIPFLILAGTSAHRLLNREFRKFAVDLVLVLGLGALLAWAVWAAYAGALGMDPMRIYASQGGQRYSRISRLPFLIRVLKSLPDIARWPIYWNSAPMAALAVGAVLARAVRSVKERRLEPVDALWLAATAVWLPFLLFKPSIDMMKYQFPVYPLYFVVTAHALAAWRPAEGGRVPGVSGPSVGPGVAVRWVLLLAAAGVMVGLFFYYRAMGDYLLNLFVPSFRPVWGEFVRRYYLPLVTVIPAAGVIGCFFFRRKIRDGLTVGLTAGLTAGLLLTAFPVQAALGLSQIGTYTTVESWMNYGEKGLKETTDYLAARVRPGTLTCFRNDIRYYIERRHGITPLKGMDLRQMFLTPDSSWPAFERFLAGSALEYLVTDPISLLYVPEDRLNKVGATLLKYYEIDQVFGSFRVYRKKTAAAEALRGAGEVSEPARI